MSRKGNLFIVSGPSGAGKDTIVSCFFDKYGFDDVHLSVSATTRAPRPGEAEGVNYYYMSRDEFLSKADAGGFLEWAQFCDNMYGTPRDKVLEKLDAGIDVILVIEVQGAIQVKKLYPDSVGVFILCPSFSVQKQRLIDRGTESPEAVEKRLETARREVQSAEHYDYVIINRDIDRSANELENIILAERLKVKNNIKNIEEVLKS